MTALLWITGWIAFVLLAFAATVELAAYINDVDNERNSK